MLYISKRVGENFEVTDTKDGVSEVVSYSDLVKFVSQGIHIEGTHFNTYNDLKSKGFSRVEALGYLYVIKLSCGNYYEVTYETGSGFKRWNKTIIGYLSDINLEYGDKCKFILFDNQVVTISYQSIKSFKLYKQKDTGLQNLMNERIYLGTLLEQKELQYKSLESEIRDLRSKIKSFDEKFLNYRGVWTRGQFIDYLEKNLPARIKQLGFSVGSPSNELIKNTDLCITYKSNAIGSVYHCSLFEREYDGALVYKHNYREFDEYKNIVRKYRVTIPNCSFSFNEGLSLSDKHYYYQCWYTISLEGKTLNEALAKDVLRMLS